MGQPTPRNTLRERQVIKWYMRNMTLAEIGRKLDISRQRAWAIVNRARKEGKLNGQGN